MTSEQVTFTSTQTMPLQQPDSQPALAIPVLRAARKPAMPQQAKMIPMAEDPARAETSPFVGREEKHVVQTVMTAPLARPMELSLPIARRLVVTSITSSPYMISNANGRGAVDVAGVDMRLTSAISRIRPRQEKSSAVNSESWKRSFPERR